MSAASQRPSGDKSVRRFKPYPAYKESGVEWLGEIPAHWVAAPVYSRYEIALGKMLDAKGVTGQYTGPYLRNVDVQWDRVNVERLPEMDFLPSERSRYRLQVGDLLVCEGGEVGRTAIWRGDLDECFYQKAIHRVRPRTPREQPRFFYYLMLALATRGVFVADGNPNTIDHLTAVQLRHYRFPFAPPLEQHTIATFLDRETARIDVLVEKKERLIELLQEKRTALITRAVTKGLELNVPMKDSGVEWLGEIPMHWGVKPLKRVFANLDKRRIPLSGEERATMAKEYPYYGASGIIDQVEEYLFDEPLILVAEDGANLYSRSTPLAFVAAGKYWVNNHAHILKPHDGMVTYWAHVLGSIVFDPWISGSAQPKLTSENLGTIPLPVPPVGERGRILALVNAHTVGLDVLAKRIRDAVDRLKELRSSLISAAATGKIDLRDEAPA